MFVTMDNAGDIRINYSTDVEEVDRVNDLAIDAGVPVVSTRYTLGGYSLPILDDISDGRNYQVVKSSIPKNSAQHTKELIELLKDTETVYAYVDAAQITVVQIEGWNSDKESLEDYGWTVHADKKTFKRLKTINRPFRIWSKPERLLRVALVEDMDYSDFDCEGLNPELTERLLDGAFVISRGLYQECLENLNFPVRNDQYQEISDTLRAEVFQHQAAKYKAFNARIFGRFVYVGLDPDDPIINSHGSLKGQAFINVSDTCESMNVDIIASRSAFKYEVASEHTYVLLEPQSAKMHANGDFQSISNNKALYDPEETGKWIKSFMLGAFEDLKNDKLMERWFKMDSPAFNTNNEKKYDNNDLINLTKWNARTWLMSGMSLKQSPWLFEQMAKNLLSIIQTTDESRMRIPIPCAIRCQVISQSFASMAGDDFEIEPGQIRWSKDLEVLVCCDEDWIEIYESHGGMDLDDFFVGYWRTINDQRKIVIMRSPNDLGEYSIFDYVDEDWYPTEQLHNGKIVEFPEVSGEPSLWPKRLSEAVRDGVVAYLGLPSENNPEPKGPHERYTMRHVAQAVENNVGSQSCVGANVNARSLWSLCVGQHRDVQLAPMESCIDTGAQGGHADDIAAVTTEAQDILKMILNSKVPIDEYAWKTRFMNIFQIPFDHSRLSRKGHASQLHLFRIKFARSFVNMARNYIGNYTVANVNPKIHVLGKRFAPEGYQLLKEARYALVAMQNDTQDATTKTWDSIHKYVRTQIEKKNKETDKYDMILSLYSACLKVPTRSTGKVSDQLVMNPDLFDMLMAALRHYGIAGHLSVTPQGKIERHYTNQWKLSCDDCDFEMETEDPRVLQSFHMFDKKCNKCNK